MIRYEIDLKQRSEKWAVQCERQTREDINVEWYRMTQAMQNRLRQDRKTLRCTRIENGMRTVLASYVP